MFVKKGFQLHDVFLFPHSSPTFSGDSLDAHGICYDVVWHGHDLIYSAILLDIYIYIHMNLNVTWYMMSWLSFSPIFNKEPPPKNELHVFHLKFWCPQSPKFWHFRKLKMIETLGVLGSICFRLREGHMFFLKFVCYLGNLCKELLFCKSLFSNHISTCKSIQPTPHTFFLCFFCHPQKNPAGFSTKCLDLPLPHLTQLLFGGFLDESHHTRKSRSVVGQRLSLRRLCAVWLGDNWYLGLCVLMVGNGGLYGYGWLGEGFMVGVYMVGELQVW